MSLILDIPSEFKYQQGGLTVSSSNPQFQEANLAGRSLLNNNSTLQLTPASFNNGPLSTAIGADQSTRALTESKRQFDATRRDKNFKDQQDFLKDLAEKLNTKVQSDTDPTTGLNTSLYSDLIRERVNKRNQIILEATQRHMAKDMTGYQNAMNGLHSMNSDPRYLKALGNSQVIAAKTKEMGDLASAMTSSQNQGDKEFVIDNDSYTRDLDKIYEEVRKNPNLDLTSINYFKPDYRLGVGEGRRQLEALIDSKDDMENRKMLADVLGQDPATQFIANRLRKEDLSTEEYAELIQQLASKNKSMDKYLTIKEGIETPEERSAYFTGKLTTKVGDIATQDKIIGTKADQLVTDPFTGKLVRRSSAESILIDKESTKNNIAEEEAKRLAEKKEEEERLKNKTSTEILKDYFGIATGASVVTTGASKVVEEAMARGVDVTTLEGRNSIRDEVIAAYKKDNPPKKTAEQIKKEDELKAKKDKVKNYSFGNNTKIKVSKGEVLTAGGVVLPGAEVEDINGTTYLKLKYDDDDRVVTSFLAEQGYLDPDGDGILGGETLFFGAQSDDIDDLDNTSDEYTKIEGVKPSADGKYMLVPLSSVGTDNRGGEGDLGFRNNNPGNLRPLGASEGYREFETLEEGFDAMKQDLNAKLTGNSPALNSTLNEKGKDFYDATLEDLIETYAPPHENDTQSYINTVAEELGVDPQEFLNNLDLDELALAMVKVESPDSYEVLKGQGSTNSTEDSEITWPSGQNY